MALGIRAILFGQQPAAPKRPLAEVLYKVLSEKGVGAAVEVFQLNVEAYPKSANVYDSLAEAQAEAGEHESAIKNYAKALELNPKSTRAIEALSKLREKLK